MSVQTVENTVCPAGGKRELVFKQSILILLSVIRIRVTLMDFLIFNSDS